jgi:hypothetical protein
MKNMYIVLTDIKSSANKKMALWDSCNLLYQTKIYMIPEHFVSLANWLTKLIMMLFKYMNQKAMVDS